MDGLFVIVGRGFAGAFLIIRTLQSYDTVGAGMGRRGNIRYRMNKGDEHIHSTFRASVTC